MSISIFILLVGKHYYGVFMTNKVNITNLNTNDIKTIDKDRSIYLLKEYKKGNYKVKDEIILGNLKLILSVIKKVNINSNIDPDDLFQVGCIGLIKSIDNFNTDLNVAFSTYAIPMISGEIKRYIRDNSNVKISRQIKDLAYKILKCKEQFIIKNNKEPTNIEIANILNEDLYKIDEALQSLNCVVSLQDNIIAENGEEMTFIDHISDDYNFEERFINSNTLKLGISSLDEISKKIIINRYYKGLTQEEIAKETFYISSTSIKTWKTSDFYIKKVILVFVKFKKSIII